MIIKLDLKIIIYLGILIQLVFLFLFKKCNDNNEIGHKISNYIVDSFYIYNAYNPNNLRYLNDSIIVEVKTNNCFEVLFFLKKKILGKSVFVPIYTKNIDSQGKYFEVHNINDTNYLFIESNYRKITVYKIYDYNFKNYDKFEISKGIVPENFIIYLNHSIILNDTLLIFRVIYDDYDEIFRFLNSKKMLYCLNLKSKKIDIIDMMLNFNPSVKYHFEYRLLEKKNKTLFYTYFNTVYYYTLNKGNLLFSGKKQIENKFLNMRYKLEDFKNKDYGLEILNYNSYYKNIIKLKNKYLFVYYMGGDTVMNNKFFHYHEYGSHLILTDSNFRLKNYILNDFYSSVFLEEFLLTKQKQVCFSYNFNFNKKINKFYVYDFN